MICKRCGFDDKQQSRAAKAKWRGMTKKQRSAHMKDMATKGWATRRRNAARRKKNTNGTPANIGDSVMPAK